MSSIHAYSPVECCIISLVCTCVYEGNITVSDGITFTVDSDLTGVSPQFTLTCISTGGPATTVIWTRDTDNITEGSETVLDDPVTAQYTHTLTVSGRLGGLYICFMANEKPSEDSAQLYVQGAFSDDCLHYHTTRTSSCILYFCSPTQPLPLLMV